MGANVLVEFENVFFLFGGFFIIGGIFSQWGENVIVEFKNVFLNWGKMRANVLVS